MRYSSSATAVLLLLILAWKAEGACRKRIRNVEVDRRCKKACTSNSDCNAANKICECDGACGLSCFNPDAECKVLEEIPNGSRTVTKTRIGGRATYRCNAGFAMKGSAKRTCYADKGWYPAAPTCERGCVEPGNVGNSYPLSSEESFAINERVKYKCYTGYFTLDSPYRTCQETGWSRASFHCALKKCDSLPDVYKGEITFTRGEFFGSTARLSCVEGYEPESTSTTIRCYAGEETSQFGQWSGELTSCRKKTCIPPIPPEDGFIHNRNSIRREYGSQIRYECNLGFKLEGNEIGRCEDDGSWGRMPNCTLDPDCDFDEYATPTCGYTNERSLWKRVRADDEDGLPGYVSEARYGESKLISAVIPQDWSDENTICLKFHYKLLRTGSSLVISDTTGHTHPDISWNSHEKETSNEWHDSLLNIRTNRPIQYQFEARFPTVQIDDIEVSKEACVDYCRRRPCQNSGTCVKRFSSRTCFCSIDFKGSDCEIDRKCPVPPKGKPNANRVGSIQNMQMPGRSVTYRCIENYKLAGYRYRDAIRTSVTSRCVEGSRGSRWSPDLSEISCVEKVCSPPPVTENQVLSNPKSQWSVGEEAVVRCKPGFDFVRENAVVTITCGSDEHWSDTFTNCQDVRCPSAKIYITHGRRTRLTDDSYWYGSTATYECYSNYKFSGKNDVVTSIDVKCRRRWFGRRSYWEPDISSLTCVDRRCSSPPQRQANVSRIEVERILNELLPGSSVTYHCIDNYKLAGEETIKTEVTSRCEEGYMSGSSYWSPNLRTIRCIKKVCPPPQLGANQRLSADKRVWSVGEEAIAICNPGYDFTHTYPVRAITCNDDEQWSEQFTDCQDVRCPEATAVIPNGRLTRLSDDSLFFGTTASYKCNSNYKFTEEGAIIVEKNTTCRRRWRGQQSYWQPDISSFRCTEIVCLTPAAGAHQFVPYHSGKRWRVGVRATYQCKVGYEFDSNRPSRQLVCGSDGEWKGSITRCKENIKCDEPSEQIKNGRRTLLSAKPLLPNATATYKCNSGYEIQEDKGTISQTIYCRRRIGNLGSNWVPSASNVTCVRVTCATPAIGDNQQLDEKSVWYAGDIAFYRCKEGYKFDSKKTVNVTCGNEGTWTGEPAQCVEDETCVEPKGRIRNGRRTSMSEMPLLPNATATYRCNDGYKMQAEEQKRSQKIYCVKRKYGLGSEWIPSVSSVTCIRVTCTMPIVGNNQRLDEKSIWYAGDIASYRCKEGYIFDSKETVDVTCGDDGNWNGKPARCVEDETCVEPKELIRNGRRTSISEISLLPNATATYKCNDGYKMQAEEQKSQKLYCIKRKYGLGSEWVPSVSNVTCIPILCKPPAVNDNQELNENKTHWTVDQSVTYRCKEGFVFDSTSPTTTITCSEEDTWSGTATPCIEAVTCRRPRVGVGQRLDEKSTWYADDFASYSCEEGYKFDSEHPVRKILCTNNGTWSGEPTQCVEVAECDKPPEVIQNGWRSAISEDPLLPGTTAWFRCNDGYKIQGNENSTDLEIRCNERNEWFPDPANVACVRVTCEPPVTDGNQKLASTRANWYVGDVASYRCVRGYEFESQYPVTNIKCRKDGTWSESPSQCIEGGCAAPVKVGQAFPITTKTNFALGDRVEYKCPPGYFITDDTYRECQRNGWSELVSDCSLQRCDSLAAVYKGQITFTNARFYGSNATLSCEKGYEPESSSPTTIRCNARDESTQYGRWSGQLPSCRKKICDSPTPPKNGVVLHPNPEQRDYGTPITYQCNIGFKLEGSAIGTCEDDGSWGQVPNCALDPDCDFEDSTKPSCGYSYNGQRWERMRVVKDGHFGYVIEGRYHRSKLISAVIPQDWSDENTICLKFRYKLLNYESSVRISNTNNHYHPDIYRSIRRNEALNVWHEFSLNIRTDRAIQYQFEVITPSVQLDDIVVSEGTCDFCQRRPCQNGGTCISLRNGHTCSCRVGFTGSNCEIDNCRGGPCRNGGTCVRNRSSYTCSCPHGFNGYRCEKVEHCWSSPCRNGGTCENNWTSYTCNCVVGFTGRNCENDFCQRRPCQNGGTCTSLRNGHTCSCQAGFLGSNCEIVNHCWSRPCLNGGACQSHSTGYTCYCAVGFSGSDCETAESKTKLDLMILIPGARFHNQQDRTAYKDWLKALGKSIIPSHKYMMSICQYGSDYLGRSEWRYLFEDKLYLNGLPVTHFQWNIHSLDLAQPLAYPYLLPRTITSAGETTWGRRKKSGWIKILVIFVERTIDTTAMDDLASHATCMQYKGISVYFIGVTSGRVNVETFKTRLQAITGSIAGDGNLQFVERSQNGMDGSIQAITEYIEERRTSCPRPNSPPQYDNIKCRWEILAKDTFYSGDKVSLECRHRESIWWGWTKWQRHNLCKTDGTWTMIYTVPCEEGNSN